MSCVTVYPAAVSVRRDFTTMFRTQKLQFAGDFARVWRLTSCECSGLGLFQSRTPGPSVASPMNSMPASSRVVRISLRFACVAVGSPVLGFYSVDSPYTDFTILSQFVDSTIQVLPVAIFICSLVTIDKPPWQYFCHMMNYMPSVELRLTALEGAYAPNTLNHIMRMQSRLSIGASKETRRRFRCCLTQSEASSNICS